MKTVRFSEDTISPEPAKTCQNCKARNITPRPKKMFQCAECFKLYCDICITNFSICYNCFDNLFKNLFVD